MSIKNSNRFIKHLKMFVSLPNGIRIPSVGLGTSGAPTEADLEKAIDTALEAGYRHIDTAHIYANEKTIGRTLQKWFKSGKLKREDVFITTKLPPTGVHPDRVEYFMKMSLEHLQLDYVDTYLVHTPIGCIYEEGNPRPVRHENGVIKMEGKTDHAAIWKKMEEQVDAGRTKTIGLSNYNVSQIETVLKSARIRPSFLQMEVHVYFQQKELLDFCKKNNIILMAYGPLGSPGYNQKMERFTKYFKGNQLPNVLDDPVINGIARKHSKNAAQVMLRFLLQLGVASTPKSTSPQRIVDNFNIFDFELDDDDMATLKSLDKGEDGRIFDLEPFTGFKNHPDYPYARR